jgi:hypothetical protein
VDRVGAEHSPRHSRTRQALVVDVAFERKKFPKPDLLGARGEV